MIIRKSKYCPYCGSKMVRVKRKPWERMLSKIHPVVRCRCCGEEHTVDARAWHGFDERDIESVQNKV